MKTKVFTEIDYHELDALINKFYGITSYNCVAVEEWNNDEDHSFSFEKESLDEYQEKEIEEIKASKLPMYSVSTVMQDLVNNDILPEGNYLISICW